MNFHMKLNPERSMNHTLFFTLPGLVVLVLVALLAAPATVAGERDSGVLEVYASLEDFLDEADEAGVLVHEDFNAERIPLGAMDQATCDNVQNSSSGTPATNFINHCFSAGELVDGFTVRMQGGGMLWLTGTHAMGGNREANVLGTLPGMAATLVDFTDPPTAVAMDVYLFMGPGTVMVEVFAIDGALMGTLEMDPPSISDPAFAGFSAPAPIGRVRLLSTNPGSPAAIGDMYFGGGTGRLEASVDKLDFGRVAVDSEVSSTVEISNSGFLDLYMGTYPTPDEPFVLVEEDCSGEILAPGEQCSVTYSFQSHHVGGFSQEAVVSAGAPFGDALGLELAGEAILPALSVVPDRWDFASADDDPLQVRLANHESVPVLVAAIQALGEPFAIDAGGCPAAPFDLAPGSSCILSFEYAPAAPGDHAGSVFIETDDPSGVRAIHLTGRLDGPGLEVDSASLDFGPVVVGQAVQQNLEILSSGTVALNIDSIEVPPPFELAGGDCPEAPFGLAPGSDCSLIVRFAPDAPGAVSENLVIESNLPSSPTQIGLAAEGTEAGLSVTPDAVDFGAVEVQETETAMLVLANTGTAVLEVTAITTPDAPFARVGGSCPEASFALPAGDECSLEVAFAPGMMGVFEDIVTVNSAAGSVGIPVEGSGVEVADAPRLSLETGTSINFGQVVVDEGSEADVVIRNTGGQVLEVTGLLGPNAPFGLFAGGPDACASTPFELAPTQSCVLGVIFEPTAAGFQSDSLVLESNAPSSPDEVTLEGEAVAEQMTAPVPVPTLGRTALLALILLMFAVTGWMLQGTRRT